MKHKHTLKTKSALRGIVQHQRKSWLALGMASLLTAGGANAALYISTLGNASAGGVAITTTSWGGISFHTDSQTYLLDQVVGSFQFNPGSDLGSLEGLLYETNSAGTPTVLLTGISFTHSAIVPNTTQEITFTPTTAVELEADSFYAFIVTAAAPEVTGIWHATNVSTGTSTDVPESEWQLPAMVAYSSTSGASWIDGGGGSYRYIGGIYATPIPEPSSMFLVSGALVLAAGGIRRRK